MKFKVVNKMNKKYSKYVSIFFEGDFELCDETSQNGKDLIQKLIEKNDFKCEKDQVLSVTYLQDGELTEVVFAGAGKKDEFNRGEYRKTLYNLLKNIKGDVSIYAPSEELADTELLTEVVSHINYDFDKYKEKNKKDKGEKLSVDLLLLDGRKISISEVENLMRATDIAKDLVNEQAEVMTPKKLAELTEEYGDKFGFQVEILDENKAKKFGMEAFLMVGRASVNRPYVIVMRYFGDSDDKYTYGLVGKGLTYDTGGLSLKPTDSMFNMKDDMGGSATVIGAMCAIAKNKLKKNVVAVVAACENSIGSDAYRPGDIVPTMAGKYIEIINTDAEGRLTLADAMTYIAKKENVSEIIDVATLTGAVVVALGNAATGVFTNRKEMFQKLDKASEKWEEIFWQLPLLPEYKKAVKSDVASLKNSGGRWGGACSAASFLEEFSEGLPWMHIDIAGTAFYESAGFYHKKGATGIGVKTLYSYIKG
ncbi:MAG: leucyl aminopeptidase [Fusobacteriaceae bacterium]